MHREMFDEFNTQGLYDPDLAVLNAALAVRMARGENQDEAMMLLAEMWQPEATVQNLI